MNRKGLETVEVLQSLTLSNEVEVLQRLLTLSNEYYQQRVYHPSYKHKRQKQQAGAASGGKRLIFSAGANNEA